MPGGELPTGAKMEMLLLGGLWGRGELGGGRQMRVLQAAPLLKVHMVQLEWGNVVGRGAKGMDRGSGQVARFLRLMEDASRSA